jgi:WD40 repeat protein
LSELPLADRVVEVIADLGEAAHPRYRYGSGSIVTGRTVLTAAHVVEGAVSVTVRDPGKIMREAALDPGFVGDVDGPGPDLALVEITDPRIDVPAMGLAAVDRDSVSGDPVERCHAVGYPAFMERKTADGDPFRETVDAFGQVPVLSGLAGGLLSVQVSSAPRELPPEQTKLGESEWSGMSGGPVVAGGLLLGVVTEHAPRAGPSAITATPLTALETDPAHPGWGTGVPNAHQWWERLGISGLAELRRLPPPLPDRPEPIYWATIREIHRRTPQLLGRGGELTDLADFATGTVGYRWLVGGAWAGKTALIAELVTAAIPPPVDVVVYFLSRREAQADSNQFLAAVVPQLASLLNEDPPVPDLHAFRALWQRAADAAARADRHLLLVVDGLDEDLRPAGSPSVAALLPLVADGHAHVLVSSRPYPELPAGIPPGLETSPRLELEPFEGGEQFAALARDEIDALVQRDDDDAVDILGVLTAAAGPLAVEDLAALSADLGTVSLARTRRVRRLVTAEAARSLQPVGPAGSRRYQFTHASLLEYAQSNEYLQEPEYRHRVYRWADHWKNRGWPVSAEPGNATPRYLLDAYPATLATEPDLLADLVSDAGWVDAALEAAGVDQVMATLRTAAAQLIPCRAPTAAIARLLQLQAHNLRPPQPIPVATQLAWESLRSGLGDLADTLCDRLRRSTPPRLIPAWTTERTSPHLVRILGSTSGPVSALMVTADGRVVSGGRSGVVRLWDPAVAGTGRVLGYQAGPITALAVSGDRRILSGSMDGLMMLWDTSKEGDPGEWLRRKHHGPVRALVVTGDGHVISACGPGGSVLLLDPAADPSGEHERAGPHGASQLAVFEDGRVVGGAQHGVLWLWDPAVEGDPGREIGRHEGGAWVGGVLAVAILADGRVVSGGGDGAVRLWDPAVEGDPGCEIGRHDGGVSAVAVLPDGRVVSGGRDGAVRLWDPAVEGDPGCEIGRQDGGVSAVAVLDNGQVISGGSDETVRLWDPEAAGGDPSPHTGSPSAVAILADGRVVSGSGDGIVRLWDPAVEGDPGREIGRHEGGAWVGGVSAVAVLDNGQVISGGADGVVRLWDPAVEDDPGREIGRQDSGVSAVAVLDNGQVISGGGDGAVRLWDPAADGDPGREIGRQEGRGGDRDAGPVLAVAVLDDRRVVSGGHDGVVRLWDLTVDNDPGQELGHYGGSVSALAITHDGRVISGGHDHFVYIASGSDTIRPYDASRSSVRVWDPDSPGGHGHELARSDGPVHGVTVTDDGRVVIATKSGVTMFTITS